MQSDKKCSRCKQRKPKSEFFKNRAQWDGLSSFCKSCHTASVKAYRARPDVHPRVNEWARNETAKERERRIADGWFPRRTGDAAKAHRRECSRRWQSEHRDSINAWFRNWRKRDPEKNRERDRNHKLKRQLHIVGRGSFTQAEFRALCDKYGNICLCCGESKTLVPDHVIPLVKGGMNVIANIQPLCVSCNSRKKDKTIDYRPESAT